MTGNAQNILCSYSKLDMVNLNSNVPSIDDLVLILIIIPNEKINRTLRMIEVKQNELWVSCRGPITLLWRTRKEGTILPVTPEDLTRFAEISARYGFWNASPEENALVGMHTSF